MIDQTTAEGKALQAVVKAELRRYLGKEYNDDVLPLYIVVMLAHGNQQPLVAENLDAFLGPEKAKTFAEWLFKHLEENPGKYETPAEPARAETPPSKPPPEDAQEAAPPAEQPDDEEAGRKRRRERRERIEWRGEEHRGGSSRRDERREERRDDRREEKRRRSSGDHELRRSSREYEREHDPRERSGRGWRGADERPRHEGDRYAGREGEREHRGGRHRERERERSQERARPAGLDDLLDRRDSRRQREAREAEARGGGGRLAGRLGSPERAEGREGGRPSVFQRLRKVTEAAEAGRTRMRMDSLPLPPAHDSPSPEPEPALAPAKQPTPAAAAAPAPAPAAEDSESAVAAELRRIRETLAKMQAEKSRAQVSVAASAAARRAVLHNVHFSATPDILRAHFGGCGRVASAVLERDAQGNPRGTATVEFEEEAGRKAALALSGSLLLGRPITVYAKESAPAYAPPAFKPRAPPPVFRPRAPAPGRGPGRAPGRAPGRGFAGRTPRPQLKNNKYVRPQQPAAEAATPAANGQAAAANGAQS